MPVTLTAVNCPPVQVPASLFDPNAPGAPLPPAFSSLVAGASGPGSLTTPFNRNAGQAAAIAEGGGGGYGIESGLALSTVSSLSLPVSAGRANLRGRLSLPAGTTVAVAPGIARIYLWLSSGGTLTPVNASLAPPAGEQLFLGSCVTSSTAVTAVDSSGVMYLRGGNLFRETADAGAPGDTPPASVAFFHKTAGGLYYWDGTRYWQLAVP